MVGGSPHFVGPGHVGGPDAGDGHAVDLVELLGLELVEPLVHGILAGAVHRVVLIDHPVAEVGLLSADGDGAGVGHPVHPGDTGRLEAIIHAQDVQLHGEMGRVVAAAQQIGQVHDAVRLGVHDGRNHVLKLHDVAAHDLYLVSEFAEVRGSRVDVHHEDLLAALDQPGNNPLSDKAGAAQYQGCHISLLTRIGPRVISWGPVSHPTSARTPR